MSTRNLRNYVFHENNRRLRDDRVSLLLASVVCIVMLAAGSSERAAVVAGLVVLVLCMFWFTIYFCSNAPQISAAIRRKASTRSVLYHPISRRLAFISLGVFVALSAASGVGAAILDRRLRSLVQREVDKGSIPKITQTLEEAQKYGVTVPRSRRTAELTARALQAASVAVSNATANIPPPPDVQGPIFARLPQAYGSSWRFTAIAANTGPDNYSTIGLAEGQNQAQMERIGGQPSVVSKYGPAVMLVKGLTATLDGFHLKHIVFQNMTLIYNGGPLILESVYFINARLQCSPGINSWRLLSAAINGGWVTVSLT